MRPQSSAFLCLIFQSGVSLLNNFWGDCIRKGHHRRRFHRHQGARCIKQDDILKAKVGEDAAEYWANIPTWTINHHNLGGRLLPQFAVYPRSESARAGYTACQANFPIECGGQTSRWDPVLILIVFVEINESRAMFLEGR